ncbi:MAG TPA: phage minor head protein [Bryobacteraceae bacterium]|jgi:SPP1 gp7 family putative phage head morphogenesis protein|nr:phage minor head protein [Bryobacteraceae bacterium]
MPRLKRPIARPVFSGPERRYVISLRKVADQVLTLVRGFDVTDPGVVPRLRNVLEKYALALEPWAEATAARMLAEVNQKDRQSWQVLTAQMSRQLRNEIDQAPTGQTLRSLLAEQVQLIKSLPLEAAQRIQDLTVERLSDSRRSSELVAEIMRTGEVTRNRANTIARTETSRAASVLTQARAQHIGSEGYIWRTAEDSDVRPSHRRMNGRFVRWDQPPKLDNLTGHAGALPNCRCYPEPVIPET